MPKPVLPNAKWNAADYAANSTVQQTWARELIARLDLRGDEHVLDVGCGDGKVTAEISCAVLRGFVAGIDASVEMIGFALRAFPQAQIPNLKFHVCDAREIGAVGRVTPGAPFDIIFSNAALHWVDNHQAILCGMASVLKSGGRLVVSCGGRGNAQDVFLALRPEMRLKRWSGFFRRMPKPYFFYAPEDYEEMAAEIRLQNQFTQTCTQGCNLRRRGRLRRVAAHDVAALCPARAGGFTRGIHRRRHGALHRQASARRGKQSPRPHGAAGN